MDTMSDVKAKLAKAISAVEKAQATPAAYRQAFDVCVSAMQKVSAALGKAESIGEEEWTAMYEGMRTAQMVLRTVEWGFPMVPADGAESVAKSTAKMTPDEFARHAAGELALAAVEKDALKAAGRILALKMSMLAWEDLPAGQATLDVTVVEATHHEEKVLDVTAAIAKCDELVAATNASTRWPRDLGTPRR